MKLAGMLGAAKADQWLLAERLLFVIGWAAVLGTLVVAGILEFSEQSIWFETTKEEQEFTRPLPSQTEISRIAKQLPASAKRFSSHDPIMGILGETLGYRNYVGYYDPICQQKAEAKLEAEKISSGNMFLLPIKRPADECVLWSYGDHYLAYVSKEYWHLDRLIDSVLFMSLAILFIVSFVNLFLVRVVWLPLLHWIRG